MSERRFYHGGRPGLEAGEILLPGHLSFRGDREGRSPQEVVWVTWKPGRARMYAEGYFGPPWDRGGDLYEVEPAGLEDYDEERRDGWAFACPSALIVEVVERDVHQPRRRRLWAEGGPVHRRAR